MTDHVTKDKAKKVHRPKTRREKARDKKFKKRKVAKTEPNKKYSTIFGYLSKFIPKCVAKQLSKTRHRETKTGHAKKRTKSKSERKNKALRIVGAVFFVLLLVVAFVGSTVGFSKCKVGFRNVQKGIKLPYTKM